MEAFRHHYLISELHGSDFLCHTPYRHQWRNFQLQQCREFLCLNRKSTISTRIAAKLAKNDTELFGNFNVDSKSKEEQTGNVSLLHKMVKAACCIFAASLLQLGTADSLTISVPASEIQEAQVSAVQRTLMETWAVIRQTYVDPTFNHQDWDSKLEETMLEIVPLKKADAAYSKIESMLATLGDPFTRIINPEEYRNFRIGSDGALEGVGLLIAPDHDTGRLVVSSSIEGSPASKAGIQAGDELLQVDDVPLSGMDGEQAAMKLRGHAGTIVTLKLRHPTVAGVRKQVEETEVKLKRETIMLSPVITEVLSHVGPDGHLIKTGYLRLKAFSQNATADMEMAINRLELEGIESYILDLHNNPGW